MGKGGDRAGGLSGIDEGRLNELPIDEFRDGDAVLEADDDRDARLDDGDDDELLLLLLLPLLLLP